MKTIFLYKITIILSKKDPIFVYDKKTYNHLFKILNKNQYEFYAVLFLIDFAWNLFQCENSPII
jgi:hypothetical protein